MEACVLRGPARIGRECRDGGSGENPGENDNGGGSYGFPACPGE